MEYDFTRNDESEVTVGTAPDFGSDTESLNDTVDGRSDVDASVEAAPVEPFAVEESTKGSRTTGSDPQSVTCFAEGPL